MILVKLLKFQKLQANQSTTIDLPHLVPHRCGSASNRCLANDSLSVARGFLGAWSGQSMAESFFSTENSVQQRWISVFSVATNAFRHWFKNIYIYIIIYTGFWWMSVFLFHCALHPFPPYWQNKTRFPSTFALHTTPPNPTNSSLHPLFFLRPMCCKRTMPSCG